VTQRNVVYLVCFNFLLVMCSCGGNENNSKTERERERDEHFLAIKKSKNLDSGVRQKVDKYLIHKIHQHVKGSRLTFLLFICVPLTTLKQDQYAALELRKHTLVNDKWIFHPQITRISASLPNYSFSVSLSTIAFYELIQDRVKFWSRS